MGSIGTLWVTESCDGESRIQLLLGDFGTVDFAELLLNWADHLFTSQVVMLIITISSSPNDVPCSGLLICITQQSLSNGRRSM